MTATRWARITSVFRAALEKEASERTAYLDQACGSDQTLRRNVERLLAGEAQPSLRSPLSGFLGGNAPELSPGDTLARYRVIRKIGEGGMGTVYEAHDPVLNRNVALKVLASDDLTGSHQERLLHEARAACALNHPNVVTVYEAGSDGDVDFIAMECVQGLSLDKAIPPKGLDSAEVLNYAVQIASALTHAHAAGILHRDLKPTNIMLTGEGRIKILDFGLAKALEREDPTSAAVAGGGSLPAGELTREGMIAGTAPYMSPEQAEGQRLDGRSDVFSFGSVLYEMATGQRPFRGDSPFSTLASIRNDDPAPPSQTKRLPRGLEPVILRCLRKDPAERYQSMADVTAALDRLKSPRQISNRAMVFAGSAAIAVLALVGWRLVSRPPETAALRTVKFTITPTNLLRGGDGEIDAEVSVSRDGKHIAYVEAQGRQLWLRDIDQEQAHPVTGATGVYQVFWSPDGQSFGYSAGRACGIRPGCDLVRIPVQGGTPAVITRLAGSFKRAFWSSDGQTILYSDSTGMYTVPARGGTATQVLAHPHLEHPSLLELPGGRRAYLYQAVDPGMSGHGLFIQVAGESRRRLIRVSTSSNPYPVYSPSGHIVYVDGTGDGVAIWALPFSLAKLEATASPFRIAEHGSSPSLSRTDTLVYSDVPSNRRQLIWMDRSGQVLSRVGEPRVQDGPALAPDGKRLAVAMRDRDPGVWVYDLDRGAATRLAADAATGRTIAWTPSGDRVLYASFRNGRIGIYSRAADGPGPEETLLNAPPGERPLAWTADSRLLLFVAPSSASSNAIMYFLRRPDGSFGEALPFLKTSFTSMAGQFSPDGRYLACVSDESGRQEIYVTDFPNHTRRWRISTNGGTAPRWRRDGKELFYVETSSLMTVGITASPDFSTGAPVRLFAQPPLANPFPQYDVSGDGNRFILLERPTGEPPLSVHVVHNWFEEFRGRQP